jgi:AraC-like DNA-binding protein
MSSHGHYQYAMLDVFSTISQKLLYFVPMFVSLKLGTEYDGLLYEAQSTNFPRMQSHSHLELELNVVVQGTITYVMNGRRFTFSPRTLLWLFPWREHQLVDRSDNARFYVAVFKPELIAKSCRTAAYEGLKSEANERDDILSMLLDPKSFDLICKTVDWLMRDSLDPALLNREAGFGATSDFHFEHHDPDALNAGLHYLLLLCWRSHLAGVATKNAVDLHPAVRRALKLLSECNTEQDLGVLAKACGASKSYLSRTFNRQVGVSLNRYRNSLRLSRFVEEYRQSDQKNIAEAAYAAGFGSYAQFYKVFTQAYGRGPRECMEAKTTR